MRIARGAPTPALAVAALAVAGGLAAVGWAVISDASHAPPLPAAPVAAPAPDAPRAAPLHQLPDLAAPAASWAGLPSGSRLVLARQYLARRTPLAETVTTVALAHEADALARLRVGGTAGRSVTGLLGLASRAVDAGQVVAARDRYVPHGLVGRSAVAARDLVGAPDLSLGTARSGVWYYDIGASQHRLLIRGGRVVSAADITSKASSGAFVGPASARPTLAGSEPVAALPAATLPPPALSGAAAGAGAQAARVALTRLGTPYVWGGETPSGFDCSGLVRWSYAQAGLSVPRVAADQALVGIGVAREDLRPGDVVFFADASGYVHHDGLYVGDGRFVHSPHTGDVVKVSSLDEPGYARQYAGARRYAPS